MGYDVVPEAIMIRNYLFVFLAVTVTLVYGATVSIQDKVTRILGYTVKDDTIDVTWSKVENDMCPILGYKINNKGTRILFQDIDVKGTDNTSALVKGVSVGVMYETLVLAYCAGAEGPLSEPGDIICLNRADKKC